MVSSIPFAAVQPHTRLRAAIVGNPNCGKTALFNCLTGQNQHVGNWAGVTVEKKTGILRQQKQGKEILFTDLPGVSFLRPNAPSLDEQVTWDFLFPATRRREYDTILLVLDAVHLERSLYLVLQLQSLLAETYGGRPPKETNGIPPLHCVVNLWDAAEREGIIIDLPYLSDLTGLPMLAVSARTGLHIKEIPQLLWAPRPVDNAAIFSLSNRMDLQKEETKIRRRWENVDLLISRTVTYPHRSKPSLTEKLDAVLLHPRFAFPIFFAVMLCVFGLTFGPIGSGLGNGLQAFLRDTCAPFLSSRLKDWQTPLWLQALLSEGILEGVGSLLTFLPQIAILFFCLSFLEDSGYIARIAFLADHSMQKCGLSGKAFIPLLMGLGCTTSACMSVRLQENPRHRKMTLLLLPFISCGAKLTIYGLFAAAFFPRHQGWIVLGLYALGIACGAASSLFLNRTVFRNEQNEPFILDLPPYRFPKWSSLLRNTWEKCKGFLCKAATIILLVTVILWLLQHVQIELASPWNPINPANTGKWISLQYTTSPETSVLADIGRCIAPLFAPLGFGKWEAAVSLLAGITAKEAAVSSLAVFGASGAGFQRMFTPISAISYMIFCLLGPPCCSALTAMTKEAGGLRWTLFSILWNLLWAYGCAFIFYQTASAISILCAL